MLKIFDAERRLVLGEINPHRVVRQTTCDYAATVQAFEAWNASGSYSVRVGFNPLRSVGKLVQWHSGDERKRIMVLMFISRGAEDVWQQIVRGELVSVDMALTNAVCRVTDGCKVLTAFRLHCLGLLDAAEMGGE